MAYDRTGRSVQTFTDIEKLFRSDACGKFRYRRKHKPRLYFQDQIGDKIMAVSSTTTTKEQKQQEKKVSVDFFHIDMIPDAMDKMQ